MDNDNITASVKSSDFIYTKDTIGNYISNDEVTIDIDNLSASSAISSNNTLTTINGNSFSNNTYTISNGTIGTFDSWVTIDDNWLRKNDANVQFNILEKYFKMNLIKDKNYDRELTKNEFLDLVANYINNITKRDCRAEFNKNILLETISFKVDNSTLFSLDNDHDLQPEIYLYFRDVFYVNTDGLLAVLKKTAFNRLLNV